MDCWVSGWRTRFEKTVKTRRSILALFGLFLIASPFLFSSLIPNPANGSVSLRLSCKAATEFFLTTGVITLVILLLGPVTIPPLKQFLQKTILCLKASLPSSIFEKVPEAEDWPRLKIKYTRILGVILILASLFFGCNASPETLSLVTRTGLHMILALGLNIAVGMAGLLVLGYAAFYQLGAYVMAVTANNYPWVPWWLLLLPTFVIGAIVGTLVGLPSLKLRGDYLAIVTLGFGEAFHELSRNLESVTHADQGLTIPAACGFQSISFHGETLLTQDQVAFFCVLLAVVVTVIIIQRIYDSRIGRAWVAVREDELAAGAMGVPVLKMKLLAFAISSGFACVAGVMYGALIGFVDPSLCTLENSSLYLTMIILGGLGSIPGALLGSSLLTIIPEELRNYFPQWGDYRLLIVGVVMVTMMLFRPQGMIGSSRIRRELEDES